MTEEVVPSNPNRILCVGLACWDVICLVKSFPKEDTDQRSLDQYGALGGNAANSSVVLTTLGEPCEYFGTLAEGTLEVAMIDREFRRDGIQYEHCPRISNCICPNSWVIVNAGTASRTIIHTNKDLPELSPDHMRLKLNLDQYDWIHFEGRNLANVKAMIEYVRSSAPRICISVEVEKPGRGFEDLIPLGDVVFVSKEIALANEATSKESALTLFRYRLRPRAKLVCAWGELGASGIDMHEPENKISVPAFPPKHGLVDTRGAGDTFNAAVIGALHRGKSLKDALIVGCKVAGFKVGQKGFTGLKHVFHDAMLGT